MYNTEIICTYDTSEVFLETDNVTEKEKEFIRDAIYRQELLNIFSLDEYNDLLFNKAINDLYNKLCLKEELVNVMLMAANYFESSEPRFGLTLLYSFDNMSITHTCIANFLTTGKINEQYLKDLQKNIVLSINK